MRLIVMVQHFALQLINSLKKLTILHSQSNSLMQNMIKQILKNMRIKQQRNLNLLLQKPEEEKDNNTNNDSNTGNQPNSEVSAPKEENNATDNKKVELTPEETAKVNLLAGIFKLSPDSLNVIETPYGKAVNFKLGEKTQTMLINDIDRLLAALLASAKPKESSTENDNSTTLNSENEVSNTENNTTNSENKNNQEKETTNASPEEK